LTFLQAAKPVGFDGGEVHEYIFAGVSADETAAFGIVKPLYCCCFHAGARVEICAEWSQEMQVTLQSGYCLQQNINCIRIFIPVDIPTFHKFWSCQGK
jgi:hypothetical protein